MILATAQSELAAQLQAAASLDAKAVGLLSFDGILLGLLGFLQRSLAGTWWLPAVLLLLSAGGCSGALVDRQFDVGPNPRDFYLYVATEGLSEAGASAAMMKEIAGAMDANVGLMRAKVWLFVLGVAALFLALTAGVYLFVRAG
jgi:hypothetical protein